MNSFCEYNRVLKKSVLTIEKSPDSSDVNKKIIVEFDSNNFLIKRTIIDFSGDVNVEDFDTLGNPMKTIYLNKVLNRNIKELFFIENKDNDEISGWTLFAVKENSFLNYIIESVYGKVNIVFQLPPNEFSIDERPMVDFFARGMVFRLWNFQNKNELKLFFNDFTKNFNLKNVEISIGNVKVGMLKNYDNVDLSGNILYTMDISFLPAGEYSICIRDKQSDKSTSTMFIKN